MFGYLKETHKKACKSMFGYLKEINIFQGAQPKTMLKLFNTLVIPILTYNSEIWGSFMKPKQLRNFDTFIKNLFDDKMAHEILQLKSGKIILGVHKKAANVAVRGELGLLPINIELYLKMIKYYLHIVDLINNGNVLMEATLEECFRLCEENKTCWLTSIRYLLKFLGIDIAKNNYRQQIYGKTVANKLKEKLTLPHENHLITKIKQLNKLHLYSMIKTNQMQESYLSQIQYYKYRSAITKFRISAHLFPIETGRWQNTERNKRFCPLCFGNKIGDEHHYLFQCTHPNFVNIHKTIWAQLKENKTLTSEKMDTKDILISILTNKNETSITTIGKYLYKIIDTYKKLTDY